MDFTQAKQRIEWLKAVLWENSRKYYVENAPTMSDYEYDQLMHEPEVLCGECADDVGLRVRPADA